MKITFPALDQYQDMMDEIAHCVEPMCRAGVYEGARVVTDAIDAEISGLNELNSIQRYGLHRGLGIARMWNESTGPVTKPGFEGYNDLRTKRWPKGQPNAMIARSVNRGTSWMPANRFVNRAVKKAKEAAIKAMSDRVDEYITTVTKE